MLLFETHFGRSCHLFNKGFRSAFDREAFHLFTGISITQKAVRDLRRDNFIAPSGRNGTSRQKSWNSSGSKAKKKKLGPRSKSSIGFRRKEKINLATYGGLGSFSHKVEVPEKHKRLSRNASQSVFSPAVSIILKRSGCGSVS